MVRSKSDQDGKGQRVAVVHGQPATTDPVAALNAWLDRRGPASGPLFTSLQRRTVSLEPISEQAIAIALRNRTRAAGFDAGRITLHSLRVGYATSAALAGASLDRIAAETRHKRLSTSSSAKSAPLKPWSTAPAATRTLTPVPGAHGRGCVTSPGLGHALR
ncbi:MAG: hypothetical protein L0H96_04420 [Humibacillus sp.]|nr:hypothetical protein [Humibacillus sp.]MDN5776134.1 hypothetical protein [Humibacillus sp.]